MSYSGPPTLLSPIQLRARRISRKSINFNVLLIGENGIGKKSFINSLCEEAVIEEQGSQEIDDGDFSINQHQVHIFKEFPINLNINITKNFGYNLNNKNNCSEIIEFLETKFDNKLQEELKVNRNPKFSDDIIELIFLFINPIGKGLTQLEIELLHSLEDKCNVIPIIGKADMLTQEELQRQKQLINFSLRQNDLRVFDFMCSYNADDNEFQQLKDLQELLPFSVISGTGNETENNNFNIRNTLIGNIDTGKYSDMNTLKYALFKSHFFEFKDITNNHIYELFRTKKLLNTAS